MSRLVLCASLVLLPFYRLAATVLHGGILYPENADTLPYYLSNKPLLEKIFDCDVTDRTAYQARELSYLFDWIDSQFIHLSIHAGYPHFLSITGIVCVGAIVFLTLRHGNRRLALDWVTLMLVLGLWLTCPSTIFAINYGRTAKIGVALCMVMACQLLQSDRPRAGWLFLVALVASLMDRQGFFLDALACALLIVRALLFKQKRWCRLAAPFAAAVLLNLLYNDLIAPRLIHHFNGYWPNFAYQRLPLAPIVQHPLDSLRVGAQLVIDWFRFMVGNLTVAQGVIVFGLLVWASMPPEGDYPARIWPALLLGVVALALVVMACLMAQRHWAILKPDLRRTYHSIPTSVLILLAISRAVSRWRGPVAARARFTTGLLAALLICNLAALPSHLEVIREGYARPSIARTEHLAAGLRRLHDPSWQPDSADPLLLMFAEHQRQGRPFRFLGLSYDKGP